MTRRASLPGADELFRNTAEEEQPPAPKQAPVDGDMSLRGLGASETNRQGLESAKVERGESPKRDGAMRPKHEEKVTFYCTPEELTRLERARLVLRAEHRLPTDRGRIVRASLSEVLDEFEVRGAESSLVRRLRSGNSNGKQNP